jgi:surfactin synthase thioesterase subunit
VTVSRHSTSPRRGAGRWFVPLDRRGATSLRLFAFPHAGGGCASFGACARLLPPGVELWALNLPGRQARFREPLRTELGPLVDELAAQIEPYLVGPYALFGYCSGAVNAFLVARRLRARGAPPPVRLVVASHPAPDVPMPPGLAAFTRLPSDEFWEQVQAHGGMQAELLAVEGYRELLEPALRADFGLLAQFRYVPEPPLDVPITVVGGRDGWPPLDQLEGWLRQTTGEFELLLAAHRRLLEDAPERLAEVLGRDLSGALPAATGGPR